MKIVKALITSLLAVVVSFVALPQPAAADNKDNWDNLSTALVFGLVGGAELKTLSLGDKTGQLQYLKTLAATIVLTEGLKAAVQEPRPDGSTNDSFPSAHTALAFAAASYFDIRYGAEHKALVPFVYGAATLTAFGRLAADKHFAADVAAGALIGVVFAHTFTTADTELSVYPKGDGVGVLYVKHF